MQTKTLSLKVLSPEEVLFEGQVLVVFLPGESYPFEVLPAHAPIISILTRGEVVARLLDGTMERIPIEGGIAKVKSNVVTVCVD